MSNDAPSSDKIPYQQAQIVSVSSELNSGFMYYDQLDTIFAAQEELFSRYQGIRRETGMHNISGGEVGDLQSRDVQLEIHELFGHLVRELSEAMQCLPGSKSWKQRIGPADEEQFQEEMADALHFFVEMCILAGISPRRLFASYFGSWNKNKERQANGY